MGRSVPLPITNIEYWIFRDLNGFQVYTPSGWSQNTLFFQLCAFENGSRYGDSYIYYCWQESLRGNGVAITVNKRVQNAVLGCNLKINRMISVHFQGKPFKIMVIQVFAPTSNAEEAEVEWFYEDLQDILELTPKKICPFHNRDWNTKVGIQETPGVTGKFGLGIWNEAGERLIEFCQENVLVIANTLFQQHKRRLYT